MLYHFKVHKDERGGYWAECVELDGCQTQGDTLDELKANMQEALDVYLSEPRESDVVFPLPKKVPARKNLVEVEATPRVAFAYLLRRERLKQRLTQKQVAARMGFKSLFAYQKLEAPKSANPGLDTLKKINEALPGFPFSRIFSR
jgi:antitoxin HicB